MWEKTFADKKKQATPLQSTLLSYLMCTLWGCTGFAYEYEARLCAIDLAKPTADIKNKAFVSFLFSFFYKKKTYISIINLQITIQRWGLLNMKRCWLSKKHPSQVNWFVSTVLKNVLLKKERRESLCYPAKLCKIKCRNMLQMYKTSSTWAFT